MADEKGVKPTEKGVGNRDIMFIRGFKYMVDFNILHFELMRQSILPSLSTVRTHPRNLSYKTLSLCIRVE